MQGSGRWIGLDLSKEMIKRSDKQYLLVLIALYLENKITTTAFCNEFYYSYDLEVNENDLTAVEKMLYEELSIVTSRFSDYEEDHKALPNGFSTKEELKTKAQEVFDVLTGKNNCNNLIER